jgi:hypothetical protein
LLQTWSELLLRLLQSTQQALAGLLTAGEAKDFEVSKVVTNVRAVTAALCRACRAVLVVSLADGSSPTVSVFPVGVFLWLARLPMPDVSSEAWETLGVLLPVATGADKVCTDVLLRVVFLI